MKASLILFFLVTAVQAAAQRAPVKQSPPVSGVYRITEELDNEHRVFKKDDVLEVSMKNGLGHYRKGKLLNRYKIIPETITIEQVVNCHMPPCPPMRYKASAYYVDVLSRYFLIGEGSGGSYFTLLVQGTEKEDRGGYYYRKDNGYLLKRISTVNGK